ncbi:MAG: GTP-binding protein [Oceanospirillaceae bacterium]
MLPKSSLKNQQKVPFTVIGGFLGAGKTSLINRLLRHAQQPYAVLVNDFGALNIDEKLIQQHSGETIALANGCICCSLAAGFSKGLGQVLDKLDHFSHVIVEASGIADPGRIQDIARIEASLEARGNIVVLDASELLQQAKDNLIGSIIHQQIDAADMLLLNKQSLLSNFEKRILENYLSQFSCAPRYFTDWTNIENSQVLNLVARSRNSNPLLTEVNNHGLFSQVINSDQRINSVEFKLWVAQLPSDILRGKGLLHFTDRAGTWLWQKSTSQSTLTPFLQGSVERGCELVLIGKKNEPLLYNFK